VILDDLKKLIALQKKEGYTNHETPEKNVMNKIYQYGYRKVVNGKITTCIMGECNQDKYKDVYKDLTNCNYIESEAYNPKGMSVPAEDSYFIEEIKN
jgi:hypothetical protein